VSDGLSGIALDVNIKELLAELSKVFAARGYRVGTPVYCRFARVALQDQIGYQLQAKACVILIGERPGLGTGDGLSAYLIYKPTPSSTHANRNCISNIHPRGLEPPLAAKLIEFTVTRMFEQNTSGVDLDLN
jgi:ethanolamine ammonia-lyase small subunit